MATWCGQRVSRLWRRDDGDGRAWSTWSAGPFSLEGRPGRGDGQQNSSDATGPAGRRPRSTLACGVRPAKIRFRSRAQSDSSGRCGSLQSVCRRARSKASRPPAIHGSLWRPPLPAGLEQVACRALLVNCPRRSLQPPVCARKRARPASRRAGLHRRKPSRWRSGATSTMPPSAGQSQTPRGELTNSARYKRASDLSGKQGSRSIFLPGRHRPARRQIMETTGNRWN